MSAMTRKQIADVLAKHVAWQRGEPGGVCANLGGAHLEGAYLVGANLGCADLGGANLDGAHLGGAHLDGADLGGADLGGAHLEGAHLGGAHLGGADLGGAHLGGANLDGADLGGADLGGAHLGGCHVTPEITVGEARFKSIGPLGSRHDYTLFFYGTTDKGERFDLVRTGCFAGSLAEFQAAVESTHGDSRHGREYRAAITFLTAMRDSAAVPA